MPRGLLLVLLYVIAISMLAIVLNMSSQTPYSPYNTGPDGYSKLLASLTSVEVTRGLDDVEPLSVVILPLTREMDSLSGKHIKNLISAGATVVILDEEGHSNKLLKDLDLGIDIRRTKVLDEVSKHESREYPVVVLNFNNTIFRIVTHRPSHIVLLKERDKEVTGSTSDYAYADEDQNGFYTLGEVMSKYIIIYSTRLDKGSLWVIADLDVLSNKAIDHLDNKKIVEALAGSRKIYIVLEGLDAGLLDIVRYALGRGHGGAYGGALIFPLVFVTLLVLYAVLEHYI